MKRRVPIPTSAVGHEPFRACECALVLSNHGFVEKLSTKLDRAPVRFLESEGPRAAGFTFKAGEILNGDEGRVDRQYTGLRAGLSDG